ncbi:hypothetical protein [Acinetobacter lactucae]|uniref:hypothetical protein n=1 Tax=Acinetobacter lactucae TaxID=1785128 RepID=UPI001580A86E|nr:hypothetical protein [Acinetobacter lactucae]NUG49678.1 hypothetical protein [Acinetobacter lactucae]
MTKYNWKDIPKDVRWLAVDADGWLFGYFRKPRILKTENCWAFASPKFSLKPEDHNYHYTKYWENSLEERPKEGAQ